MSARRVGRVAAAAAATLAACAVHDPEAPARSDRAAIQGGQGDTASSFAVAVVDSEEAVCSGTLIAPNLVLTARHCVSDDNGGAVVDCDADEFGAPKAPATFRVTTGATAPPFADSPYAVSKVLVPDDAKLCGNDIALLVLEALVPQAAGKVASPAVSPPLTDRATYGSSIAAIGFGITGPTEDDDGVRRRRDDVPIVCVPGDATLGCDPSDFDMTDTELAAGDGLCTGDSGSGAYVQASVGSSTPVVLGVLSRAGESGSTCTDAIYTRTDSFAAFLVAGAKEAAKVGGYAPPAWAGGPSDAGRPDDGAVDPTSPPSADEETRAAPPSSTAPSAADGCAASGRRARVGNATLLLLALAGWARRRRAR